MNKILIITLLGLVILSACSPTLPADGAEIPWDEAVHLLHSGEVTQIFQRHNLQVTLTLVNGTQVTTTEPSIDAIFFEVEQCGATCMGIGLATE